VSDESCGRVYASHRCASGFCCQRRGHVVDTGRKFLIEHEHGRAVAFNQFETVEDALSGLFFFDLLGDEPVEASACGVVVFGFGQSI